MRLNSRTWFLISLLLFAAAAFFWQWGDKQIAARRASAPKTPATQATPPQTHAAPATAGTNAATNVASAYPYRLTNTRQSMAQLERNDHAVLLRNALIDTTLPIDFVVPDQLKANDDPGSYIVQSRRPLDQAFYALVRRAGAQFVSYIPNNAALVSASANSADQLRGNPMIQSVLPYEPYYKLDRSLLALAVEGKPLGTNNLLSFTGYENQDDALMNVLARAGVKIIGKERSPFGSTVTGNVPEGTLPALAKAAPVQSIERPGKRVLLNDLSRPILGVASDSVVSSNYLGLTGANVVVAVNDSGVDASHPDLTNRVFAATNAPAWLLGDTNYNYEMGHGTHVAGIIAGSGSMSDSVSKAPGSILKAVSGQFRGKAPGATLFIQSVDLLSGPLISDAYLQENASKSNALICNNSWGYGGIHDYTMSAASYDAATRDAQPGVAGSQPLLFIFAAGNDGSGDSDGGNGFSDTVNAPATAKNVITVGALESLRNITNEVVNADGNTNAEWSAITDSAGQVASFSSRGNVGIGIEGVSGRFKPDVVAPGVFTISTRPNGWTDPTAGVVLEPFFYGNQQILSKATNVFQISVPDGGVEMMVQIYPNGQSPVPFPTNLLIYADMNPQPVTSQGGSFPVSTGDWYVGVYNPNNQPVACDIGIFLLITNDYGNRFQVLSDLNAGLAPYYRYESGTSMAAPAVSGVLALMQEYLQTQFHINPSPALMKALLINGARLSARFYDYQVKRDSANDEGWGVVQLANSIPSNLTTNRFFDQTTNALATGESDVRTVQIADEALDSSLRVTLVWTDPPGNPAAGVKLVNDLDLIVSNTVTHEVFTGNNFPAQSAYTDSGTNEAPSDVVNNVENVYINGSYTPLSSEYVVIVRASRVNVNAVTAHPDGIVQDYALVISSGNTTLEAPFSVTGTTRENNAQPWVMTVTNGVPLLYQRVGANSPLLGGTNGTASQWRFFVFTNELNTNTPYVAFVTFMPPNLSTPRNTDADIDLYVSTLAGLTNLVDAAIDSSDKSLNRGGTEYVIYTNSPPGTVYYVGVKSEDQKAAEFGLMAVASSEPFSQKNDNGDIVARGIPLPAIIPDGTPQKPEGVPILAIGIDTENPASKIRRVAVEDRINHPYIGDLVGILSRGSSQGAGNGKVYVNSHSDYGTNLVTFDDSGEMTNSIHTDGPGSLRDYIGGSVNGAWLFWMYDNAAAHNGQVEDFSMVITPRVETNNDFNVTIRSGGWYFDYIDVPSDATNLNIAVTYNSVGGGPVDILLRKGDFPPPADGNAYTNGISALGGSLNWSITNTPPLSGGRWYYAIHNESATESVALHVLIRIDRRMVPDLTMNYLSMDTPTNLVADMVTRSVITVPKDERVFSTQVGVRINDPRASDLALTLTSPQGTRVVLFENRGRTNTEGLGLSITNASGVTNIIYAVFTENTNYTTTPIKFALPPYGSTNDVVVSTNQCFTSNFDTDAVSTDYTNGQSFDKWTVVSTNTWATNQVFTNSMVSVVHDVAMANSGSNFLALAAGHLVRTVPTTNRHPYRLTYAYRGPGIVDWWSGNGNTKDLIGTNDGTMVPADSYAAGEVDRAFSFDGANYVGIPNSPSLNTTNDFTIEAWINTTKSNLCQAIYGLWNDTTDERSYLLWISTNNALAFGLSDAVNQEDFDFHHRFSADNLIPLNQWTHVAVSYEVAKGMRRMFVNGDNVTNWTESPITIVNSTGPAAIGAYMASTTSTNMLFNGKIDEVSFYNRALSPAEISGIYSAGAMGKYSANSPMPSAQVVIDGTPSVVVGNDMTWQTNTYIFNATSDLTTIELDGNPLGILFDSFKLEELPSDRYGNYYLPEESLDVFKGENALGDWTLQAWDTRTWQPANANLISWDLQLTFSSTNVDLIVLTNRMLYTNSIATNSYVFFGFDVPVDANFATNSLTNITTTAGLNLLFSQTDLPTGTLPGDVTLMSGVTSNAMRILGINSSQPPIQPGQRYFLGLYNPSLTEAQDYGIQIDTDGSLNFTATPLANTIPLTTNVVTTDLTQYYYYDVSTNATAVLFEVLNPTNDVDLLVHKGLPLPGDLNFDYISADGGTNSELVLILTNSFPVPLSSGRWYLAVTPAGQSVSYTVLATEFTAANPLVTLTNQVTYTNIVSGNSIQYFIVDAPVDAAYVTHTLITTNGATSGLSLLFNQSILPTGDLPGDYTLLTSVISGTNMLSVSGVPQLQPGQRYFLGVYNTNSEAVDYTLNVDFGHPVTPLDNGVVYTESIASTNTMQYYSFDVSAGATMLSFEILNPSGDVNLLARRSWPYPNLTNYDYASTNLGTNCEFIVVTNSLELTPGQWLLAVYNVAGTNDITYDIRATELDSPVITPLTNAVSYSSYLDPSDARQFYSFDVSSNSTLVSFEILNPGDWFDNPGDWFDMVVRRDLPLPDHLNADYLSYNQFPNDQSIVISTNSAPVSLTPGRWYVGVYNSAGGWAANYEVRATEATSPTLVPLVNGVIYTNAIAAPGLAFDTNHQFVFYQFTITNNDPAVVFTIMNMSDSVGLLVRNNNFPATAAHDFGSLYPQPFLLIATNTSLPSINGTWYLAVPNSTLGDVSFDIAATLLATNALPAPVLHIPPTTIGTNGFKFSWTSVPGLQYTVDVSTNLPEFTELTTVIALSTATEFIDSLPMDTAPMRFYRVRLIIP